MAFNNDSGVQAMQMTRPTRAKRAFMRHVLDQVEEHGDEKLSHARNDKVMGEPDWRAVQHYTDLQPKQLMRRYSSKLGSMRASSTDIGPSSSPVGKSQEADWLAAWH